VKVLALVLVSGLFDYGALNFPASKVVFTVTPDRFCLLLLFVVFISGLLKGRSRLRSAGGFEIYIMAAFGILCTVSWLTTGLDFGTQRYRWLTTLFNLIYFPFGVYLVAKNTQYERQAVTGLLRVVAGIGTYLGITGVCEHFRITWLVWPKYILDPTVGIQFGRVRGPFATAPGMGEWLILTFVAASLLSQFARGYFRWHLWGVTALAMMGIYFTDTREIWVSFAAVVVIGIAFGGRLRARSLCVALIVVMAFVIGVGSKFSASQKTLFSRRQETVNYRLANFQTAYKMGMDNVVMGVGYGNFSHLWRHYFGPEERALIKELTDGNHNTYLGLFAETGIFGLLLYVSLLVSLAVKCIAAWRQRAAAEDFEKSFIVASLSLVIVTMIEAAFGDQRFDLPLNVILCLCVGIVASMKTAEPAKAMRTKATVMPLRMRPTGARP
jgi:O-antigen ligase